MRGSRRIAQVLLAVALFSLTALGVAVAQEADVLGKYPLEVSSTGTICPEDKSATLEVTAVTQSSITFVLNGTTGTLSFDPATQQFSGNYSGSTLSGSFSGDTVSMTSNYASGTCISTFTGSRSGGGAGGGVPIGVLIGGGLALVLVGGAIKVFKVRKAPASAPAGAAGPAGKFGVGTAVMNPSVGADRSGGFEDTYSYGEGGRIDAPMAGSAYEALVVAQAPRTAQGAPLITATGGLVREIKPFWTQRGLIDLNTGALLDPTTGNPYPEGPQRRVISR